MRDQPAKQTSPTPESRRDPVVRGANAIDRYSLALQLIQVYPIILASVAVVLPLRWLRILVATLGLLFWTLWAVIRERGAESAERHAATGDDAVPQQSAVETSSIATTTTVETVHGIRVDVWLHPHSPVPREPVGRRPHRPGLPRAHRAIPPKPHPHHQSRADEPEPEDRPGTPTASAWRLARG